MIHQAMVAETVSCHNQLLLTFVGSKVHGSNPASFCELIGKNYPQKMSSKSASTQYFGNAYCACPQTSSFLISIEVDVLCGSTRHVIHDSYACSVGVGIHMRWPKRKDLFRVGLAIEVNRSYMTV